MRQLLLHLQPAVGLPVWASCADPSGSIQIPESLLLSWPHIQDSGCHKAISATSFTSFTLSNILGQKGLLLQTLLPEVMRIYSSQLTSPHKVLSWLYLFMTPSWYRFFRCIWSLFYFFLPLHSIGTEEFLQNMQSCPAIFCIQINI